MTEQAAYRRYGMRGRVWTEQDTERYVSGGYDTVVLTPERGDKVTLDFLRDLPNLRGIDIDGPVRDDTPVFDVPSLEVLTLLTRSKKPLRLDALPNLRELAVHDRPGLDGVAALTLRRLLVAGWRGADLTFLGDQPELGYLRVEGRKQRARLDGVERAPRLDELMVLDVCLESVEPLRGLANLRELHLTGVPGMPAEQPWDLSALAGKPRLAWFHAGHQGPIRSLAPLRDLPALTSVGVGVGAEILDGDLSVLVDLPPHVSVGPFDARDHYTHTPQEVRRLRG